VIDARFGGVSGGDLDVRETLRVALLIAPLMHNGAATSAPRPEVSGAMGARREIGDHPLRCARGPAAETIKMVGRTFRLGVRLPLFEIRAQIGAPNDMRTAIGENRQLAGSRPVSDGVLVNTETPRRIRDFVWAVDFDPTRIDPLRHRSSARRFKQRPDVLSAPDGRARAELHGLRKAAILDALPPAGSGDRDRPGGREDLAKANKAGFGECGKVLQESSPSICDGDDLEEPIGCEAEIGFAKAEFGYRLDSSDLKKD